MTVTVPQDDHSAEERIVRALRAASGPLGFAAVAEQANVHQVQAARVLGRLELRYVVLKTNGRYMLGSFQGEPVVTVVAATETPQSQSAPARGSRTPIKEHAKGKVRIAPSRLSPVPQPPAPAASSIGIGTVAPGTNVAIDNTVPFHELADGVRAWLERATAARVRASLIEHHLRELEALLSHETA